MISKNQHITNTWKASILFAKPILSSSKYLRKVSVTFSTEFHVLQETDCTYHIIKNLLSVYKNIRQEYFSCKETFWVQNPRELKGNSNILEHSGLPFQKSEDLIPAIAQYLPYFLKYSTFLPPFIHIDLCHCIHTVWQFIEKHTVLMIKFYLITTKSKNIASH